VRIAIGTLLAGAILGGAFGALGGVWIVRHTGEQHSNLHDMIHQDFELTSDERTRLKSAETGYDENRAAIEARLKAANLRLAQAIKADPRMSPEVSAASADVERAAAELQSVTLRHIFEMRGALEDAHRANYDEVLIRALSEDR
jgi:nickel and cobalt resistance protein CnrR